MARLSPSSLFSTLSARTASLRASVERGVRRARNLAHEARREAEAVARRAGLPTMPRNEPPVIDVGETPSFAIRLVHGAAGALVLALLFGGAVSLGLFILQILAAYLLSTRVLGIRVDIAPPQAA
jgi:hypothetical protein